MKIHVNGKTVDLPPNSLLAQGGEGSVYLKDGVVYKLYQDSSRCISADKIAELKAIQDRRVVLPQGLVQVRGKDVGYWMQHLAPLFTRAFCQRRSVTMQKKMVIANRLRDLVANVHAAGVLVVDLNELNFLLTPQLDDVWAIDVDSYQTKHFPATAIMETVRDRHVKTVRVVTRISNVRGISVMPGGVGMDCAGDYVDRHEWTEGSDWFSFGVVVCQLFTGVHPYKGRHPTCHDDNPERRLEQRMQNNLSIFRQGVVLPPTASRLSDIPRDWSEWMIQTFDRGERQAPPTSGTVTSFPVAMPVQVSVRTARGRLFDMKSVGSYSGDALQVVDCPEGIVVLSTHGLFVNGNCIFPNMVVGTELCQTDEGELLFASVENNMVTVRGLGPRSPYFVGDADDLTTSGGRLYIRRGELMLEMAWVDMAGMPRGVPKLVATIMPNAKVFPGCVLQQLLDAWYAVTLPGSGVGHVTKLPELQGYEVVEAFYQNGMLAVLATNRKTGRYDRLLYRDQLVVQHNDVGASGLNLAVLAINGLCVMMDEDGRVHAIPVAGDSVILEDPAVRSGRLFSNDTCILLVLHGVVYKLSRKGV